MDILAYTMDEILDPTNIIEGQRFEFLLDIEVDEEDELFVEGGLEIRAIVGKKRTTINLRITLSSIKVLRKCLNLD